MRRALTTVLLAALALGAVAVPAASGDAKPLSRVVIVLSPHLTWDDVRSESAPVLARLARSGAVGNLNIRNRNGIAMRPDTLQQSALTLSAGAWAALDANVPSAYSVTEEYNAGTAGEEYTRLTGESSGGEDIVFLGMPRIDRLAESAGTIDARPGTLGGEIVAAGGVCAALGNSDPGRQAAAASHSRPAALLAMDYAGRVRYGDVSQSFLRDDTQGAFGVVSDVTALSSALDRAEASLLAEAGPALVVVDSGDLERAAAVEGITSPALAADQHARAVQSLDRIVERVWQTLPEDALLMVLTPVETETSTTVSGLAPTIVYGSGFSGNLISPSTHRTGLVSNMDIAATVLDVFDIARPVQVLGNVMTSDGSDRPFDERIDALMQMDVTATSVDVAKPAVLNGFIGATLIVLLCSTLLLIRAARWRVRDVRRLAAAARIALLGVLSVPPASLIMFIVDGRPRSSAGAVFVLFAVAFVLWALLLVIKRYAGVRAPLVAASLTTAGLILVDQWLGAPWSFTSFLGYSPLMAARFYGIGNEGAAILFGAALTGVAFLFDTAPESRVTRIGTRWGLPLMGLLLVGTAAAPFLGANVGVAVWGVVGFAIAWALMNGHRVSWKTVLVGLLVIVVLIGVFSAIDLSGSAGAQTHLGRAWASAGQGGVGELWLIVQRKVETNLRVLTHTNWSFILIGVLAFLGFMRWHPRGDFADTLDANPHFSAAIAACLWGGLAAYFTEDSGIVIPALILLYVGTGILYLMTSRLGAGVSPQGQAVIGGPVAGDGEA